MMTDEFPSGPADQAGPLALARTVNQAARLIAILADRLTTLEIQARFLTARVAELERERPV